MAAPGIFNEDGWQPSGTCEKHGAAANAATTSSLFMRVLICNESASNIRKTHAVSKGYSVADMTPDPHG